MTIQVLDACAMIAYLLGESGGSIVATLLADRAQSCYAHPINFCEVYYQILRQSDQATALQAIADLRSRGIVERADMDEVFWLEVAAHKARGRISLADCFCLALAVRLNGRVVTADHGEFDPLVPLGLRPILFIR